MVSVIVTRTWAVKVVRERLGCKIVEEEEGGRDTVAFKEVDLSKLDWLETRG